jgi:DNA-binding response OmpR family regulator
MIEFLSDQPATRISVSGETVKLTVREAELLQVLAARAGEVVTKRELLLSVWGTTQYIDPDSLSLYVGRLRRKLGPGHIFTSNKIGYMYKP